MDWETIDSELKTLSDEETLRGWLTNLINTVDEANKRIDAEAEIYGVVAAYFNKVTSGALAKLKSKDKERYERAEAYLKDSGCDKKYKQWKTQADSFRKFIQPLIKTLRDPAAKLLKDLEKFSTGYGKYNTFIVAENEGRIKDEDLKTDEYLKTCIKRCDDEFRRAFKFKSMKEYKNAIK